MRTFSYTLHQGNENTLPRKTGRKTRYPWGRQGTARMKHTNLYSFDLAESEKNYAVSHILPYEAIDERTGRWVSLKQSTVSGFLGCVLEIPLHTAEVKSLPILP